MPDYEEVHGQGESSPWHRITARGLRLSFRWTGDRWAHGLDVRATGPEGAWVPLVCSCEGDPTAEAPERVVSPAYQQFHHDERLGAALLVGQSGKHHFSAAFRLRETTEQVTVAVDVADRMPGHVPVLACTYRVDLPITSLLDAQPHRVTWQGPGPSEGRLIASVEDGSDPPTELALAEAGRRGTHLQAVAQKIAGASTQRCRYAWTWSGIRAGSPRLNM